MPTNGLDHREEVDLPPNALELITGVNNNNNQELSLFETLFCAMFFSTALEYARLFPKSLRRVIEFVLLLQVNFYFILNVDVYHL